MAKFKKHKNLTRQFLESLYETLPDGYVELRLKENGNKGKIRKRIFAGNYDKVEAFVEKYVDRTQKDALYYGVGKRIDQTDGTKENVLGCTALWADVDVTKHGWDMKATVEALYRLPGCLQPSAIVFSGGGLHPYWLLKEPAIFKEGKNDRASWGDRVERFEMANKAIQRVCSSDNIFDISRVLRLPGGWHTKAKAQLVDTVYFFRWHRTDIKELADAAKSFGKVLGPSGFVHPKELPVPANAKITPIRAYEIIDKITKGQRAKHYADIWDRCRLGGLPPYIGLDEAVLLATAHEYIANEGASDQVIIDKVTESAIEVQSRDASLGDWQWSEAKQREFIQDKLTRFKPKWKAHSVLSSKLKRAAVKEAKAKMLRVLVTGGRDYEGQRFVFETLDDMREEHGDLIIIQGGADGADKHARNWAKGRGLPVITEKANWDKHGKAAGPLRNKAMIEKHTPQWVIAFPGGRGTADMVRRAKDAGLKVKEMDDGAANKDHKRR